MAGETKETTDETDGRMEKGNINSARHGQAQCMLSSSLGSSSCAAFVLVPRHNCENCMSICLPLCLSVRLSATYAEALQPAQLLQDSHCVPDIIATIAFVLRSPFRLDNFFVPLSFSSCLSLSFSPRQPAPLWLHSVNTVANCYYSGIIVLCDCKRFSINWLCNNKHNIQLAFSVEKF